MFERFTERARQVVVLAQQAALDLHHNYIGTEHILMGLLREEEGLAARVLASMDVTEERTEAEIKRVVGFPDEESVEEQLPFTPRAKKIMELSLREALGLGHNYIGTEHILLGLVRENEGVAARILLDFDADSEKIRNEVIRMLSGPGGRKPRSYTDLHEQAQEILTLDAMFLENHQGRHIFVYDKNHDRQEDDARSIAGQIHIDIPNGRDPLAYEFGEKVEITIRKKV